MQIIYSFKKGYVTIFISLVFTIILSLVLILVEGVQRNATRVEAKLVAELGIDSCLAEYDRDLWKNYDQLFINTAYKSGKGSIGRLQKHLKDYVVTNCEQKFIGHTSMLKLENPYLEIEKVSLATDEYGKIWKKQAVNYMLTSYGMDIFKDIIDTASNADSTPELLENISEVSISSNSEVKQLVNKKEAEEQKRLDEERERKIESAKSQKAAELGRDLTGDEASQVEASIPREIADLRHKKEHTLSFSLQGLTDKCDEYMGKGILHVVIPSQIISARGIEREGLVSERITKENNFLSIPEEVLFCEYLFDHFGYFGNEKENTTLKYEVEYILSGRLSDEDNLRVFAEKLLAVREASNYMYIKKDLTKQAQLQTVAAGLSALIFSPEAQPVIYNVLQGMWVTAESLNDLKIIFNGGRVPLYKTYDDWNISLEAAYKGAAGISGADSSKGMNYKDYLRVLLIMFGGNSKAPRSMDLVENNLGIKMDDCVYSFTANFGFEDDRKHSFVFSRGRSYE